MFHDYAPVFIIGMLNSFAEMTENGIIDFDTYVTDPEKYDGFLIYDKSNGKVVCDTCVDELHSDIVSYYDFFDGVDIASSRMMVSLSMSISAGAASWSRMAVGTSVIFANPII